MGNKKQTILTLNGRRYNALTGEIVEDDSTQAVRPISDVISPRASTTVAATVPKPTTPAQPSPSLGPKVMDISRSASSHTRRQPQRATTLIRSAVSKPKPSLKSRTKVVAPTAVATPPLTTIAPKWPVTQVNPSRQNRAEQTTKSTSISKFSANDFSATATPSSPHVERQTVDDAVASIEHQSHESRDLFERAIEAADSHTQVYTDPKKLARQARKQAKSTTKATRERPLHHHIASVVAASVAVIALGTFVGFQNKTAITLRFADAKAGFNASLPTYQPTGYGVDRFNYSAGVVGTSFRNSTANRSYTLTQQSTDWDSQALLDNFVTSNYPSYQILQSGQQIIYIYGKNDASWVKNHIWYQLENSGSLSTSQVLNLASSI